jgi:hypothetical protein
MSTPVVKNFMKQQGFPDEGAELCNMHFEGLYFQPRIVFPLVLVGIAFQSATLFFLLSALLWWNTLLPALNPFEWVYNLAIAASRGTPPLATAPGPRRFAQGMAAAFLLGAGLALRAGRPELSWLLQGLLVIAFLALLFGRFCLGAYVYHVLRGRLAFANSTLPWVRG